MNSLDQRLTLTLSGFTPTNLGMFVYVLNKGGLFVTEQALRAVIPEGVYDFERRFDRVEKVTLATAIREIIREIGHQTQPRIDIIRDTLHRVDKLLGTAIDQETLDKMARYLFYDWESILKAPEEGRTHMLDFVDMHAVDLNDPEYR